MKTTETKDTTSVKSHGSVNETDNRDYSETEMVSQSEELETHKIVTTPFMAIRQGLEWYVMLGTSMVSRGHTTLEAAAEDGRKMTWDRVMNFIAIMIEKYEPTEKE